MIYILVMGKELEKSKERWDRLEKSRKRAIKYYYEELKKDENAFREKRKEGWKKYKTKHPEKVVYKQVKNRCKKRGILFELSEEDVKELLKINVCPICGESELNRKFEIDRIVPELGYVINNVDRVCCRCNRIKSDGTIEDFKKIIKYIENANFNRAVREH